MRMRSLAPRIFIAEDALARLAAATAPVFRNVLRAGFSKLSCIDIASLISYSDADYSRLSLDHRTIKSWLE
jgi:hypothetical protein